MKEIPISMADKIKLGKLPDKSDSTNSTLIDKAVQHLRLVMESQNLLSPTNISLDLYQLLSFTQVTASSEIITNSNSVKFLHIALSLNILETTGMFQFGSDYAKLSQICINYIKSFVEYFGPVRNFTGKDELFRSSSFECVNIVWRIVNYLSDTVLKGRIVYNQVLTNVQYMKIIRIMSRIETIGSKMGKSPINIIQFLDKVLTLPDPDMGMITECAAILANTASIRQIRDQIVAKGCLTYVMIFMDKFIAHPSVETEICACLSNMALFEESCRIIIDSGGMQLLIRLLLAHMKSPELQTQVLNVLTNISKQGKRAVDENQLLQTIVSVLTTHDSNHDLLLAGINAIGSLAFSKYHIGSFKSKLTELIVSGMKRFEWSATFQVSCCFALAHLCYGSGLDLDTLKSMKGLEVLLKAMKNFSYNRSLQTTACFAIGSLCMIYDDVRADFLSNGGIKLIFAAMERDYPKSKEEKSAQKIITAFHIEKTSNLSEEDLPARTTFIANEGNDDDDDDIQIEDTNRASVITLQSDASSTLSSLNSVHHVDNENPPDQMDIDIPPPRQQQQQQGRERPIGKMQNLQKELLLQMFVSVALMNMAENEKCREELQKFGVLHYLFHAALKVKEIPELSFVLSNVFMRFTHVVFSYCYLKPAAIPPLFELAAKSYMTRIRPKPDDSLGNQSWIERIPLLNSLSGLLKKRPSEKANSLPNLSEQPQDQTEYAWLTRRDLKRLMSLPVHIRQKIVGFIPCANCKFPCYPVTAIRMYCLTLSDNMSIRFCSENCAKQYQYDNSVLNQGDRVIQRINISIEELMRNP